MGVSATTSVNTEIIERLEDSFRHEGKKRGWDEKISGLQAAFDKQQSLLESPLACIHK